MSKALPIVKTIVWGPSLLRLLPHRSRRSDAKREHEHGDGGEAGVLQQLAEGVAKVIKHRKKVHQNFARWRWKAPSRYGFPACPSTVHEMVQTGARDRIQALLHQVCRRPNEGNEVSQQAGNQRLSPRR